MQATTQRHEAIPSAAPSTSTGETTRQPYASYEIHPAATLFPLMHGVALGELAADIAENGLIEPIVVYRGQILDGRNRLRACEMAQVEPRFDEWDGSGSPLTFVLARNLHRRHLNESQRAMIAARARELFAEEATASEAAHQFGSSQESTTEAGEDAQNLRETTGVANLQRPSERTNIRAAEMLNVSPRSVCTASKVLEQGDEEVIAAVDAGTVAVSDAAAVIELPKPKQRQAIERVRSRKSRTLRQAVREQEADESRDDSSPANESDAAEISRLTARTKLLRGECQKFAHEVSKLLDRIEGLARAIGGHTIYTDRVHQGLRLALRSLHEYLTLSAKK